MTTGAYIPGSITSSLLVVNDDDDKNRKKVETDSLFSRSKKALIGRTITAKRASDQQQTKSSGKRQKNQEVETSVGGKDGDEESDVQDESQQTDEQLDRTIFVGNVRIKATSEEEVEEAHEKSVKVLKKLEKELRKEFVKYGEIETVRLR